MEPRGENMPLTPFQIEVFRTIASNRSPESFVAGATVLHREEGTPRYSKDIDLFHDAEESVAISAARDSEVLCDAGYSVEWEGQRLPSFRRATIVRGGESVRMEWVWDSAWRFFPLLRDELMGYRLHLADIATNKVIAAAERGEIRDYIDLVHLDGTYLGLGAIVWAACGKNPGYTPELMFQQLGWRARFRPEDLKLVRTTREITPESLKREWLSISRKAEPLANRLPLDQLGSLYLNASGEPVTPDPSDERAFSELTRHEASIGGAWPRIVDERTE